MKKIRTSSTVLALTLALAACHREPARELPKDFSFFLTSESIGQAADGQPAVNARDRIGSGPWINARGQVVARNIAHLHGDTVELGQEGNDINKATAYTETNETRPGYGDKHSQHDVITGSQPDGRAYTDAADHTCHNYTSSAPDGSAQVGHFDRAGYENSSWNSAHKSHGCSQDNLASTGGAGYLYCFATN